MADLYIKNAQVVTENEVFFGGIVINGEQIAEVVEGSQNIDASEVIDLDGQVLLPGIIDDHVHFNEPGRENWEGYRTGSMAAAAGGVTTILEMPLGRSR
jgi:allantoinase